LFVVVEAVDPFKWALTSMLITYKVRHILHMLWMCICMSAYHVIAVLVSKAFGSHIDVTCFLLRGTPRHSAIVEAVDPINIDPTLISNVYYDYVFHNLHMMWVCTYMSPSHLQQLLSAKLLKVT
jgi:hypothetical protein